MVLTRKHYNILMSISSTIFVSTVHFIEKLTLLDGIKELVCQVPFFIVSLNQVIGALCFLQSCVTYKQYLAKKLAKYE